MYDLTTAGASANVGGALFISEDQNPTGSGVYESFVRIGGNSDVVQGYNTRNEVMNTGNTDTFNHELLLSAVPVVNIGGTWYREFVLDVNQTKSHPNLSLDELQIFLWNTPNSNTTSFSGGLLNLPGSTLVYDLDASSVTSDNWLRLNYALGSGSGSGDLYAYIPNNLFTGGGPYVYLYSRFGDNVPNNDGFEEWGTRMPTTTNVPEPTSLALVGLGLTGFICRRRFSA
jgi:hypothetical protein